MKSSPNPVSAEELQARLAAIVASSDDAIVSKTLDGIIQSWNASAHRVFGFTADEAIGSHISIIIPPENLDEETQIIARLKRGERIDHFKTVRRRKDGQRISIVATISPIRDASGKIIGASKVARDVTPLAQIEGMLSAIVASSDDAIVGKNLCGIVRSWNASAERIFGYTASEMIGQPITLLMPADRVHEEAMILDRIKRGERVEHFESIRRRKDGSLVDVSVTISPIRDALGNVIGASKIARDVTVLKKIEQQNQHLLESEQAARREAERSNRMKDEFLATLSHELRTPLNAILGWAQLLRTAPGSAQDLSQGLETIERNARAQTQLIDELLDMSRIISGKVRLDVQRLDLTGVINAGIDALLPAADAKGIRVQRVLDPRSGPVSGDPNRLQQVVWNLVSNAIKFTPKGGRVQISLQRVNSHVEVAVADTGPGIKADFLPHLFERFTQADASTTRHQGGLGLGLAIVRHLVELHGGSVTVNSAGEGQGATFIVKLPLSVVRDERPHDDARHPEAGSVSEAGLMNLRGVKVLTVDDEPDARELVRRVLESCHAIVTTAESANQAFEILARERPNVLICDIGMPGQDGFSLLARVRALSAAEGGDTPAVALTAFARSEDRRRALLCGFQMHVPKPVEPAELIAVVASLAGVARRQSN